MSGVNLAPRPSRRALREAERAGKTTASHVGTFRKDIQGMRAIAVLLVLLAHGGIPGFNGGFIGVDVFFVLSGFLITGIIVREIDKTGRLRLWNFWARRIRRLLPAASVVLIFVTFGTMLTLPLSRWLSIVGDVLGGAFYYINWRFALNSVDYMAAESAASPVQHYWSLSIEEQFYVVLPLLIIAMIVAFRVFGKRKLAPNHLIVMLTPIVLASFLWSVHYTSVAAAPAYFVSTTRAWEMGVGSILALAAAGGIRLAHRPRVFLAGLGVVMIIGAAIWFTPATPYPGSAALLPVLGTVLVILAGTDAGRGPIPAMSSKPAQFIGDISYSLYLWHWPIVVFLPAFIRPQTPSETLAVGVAAVALSVIPAYLSYRFVEKPIHKSPKIAAKKWSAPIVLAACLLVAVACAGVLSLTYQQRLGTQDIAAGDAPGAAVLGLNKDRVAYQLTDWPTDVLLPNPAEAKDDRQRGVEDGCHLDQANPVPVGCQIGPVDSGTSVVLIGDSHAAQWQTALDIIAVEEGWDFTTYTKSACLWADTEVWNSNFEGAYESCTGWSNSLTELLVADSPELVLVSQQAYQHVTRVDNSRNLLTEGVIRAWQPVIDAGARIVVIADTPTMGGDIVECVENNSDDLAVCNVDLDDGLKRSGQDLQRMVLDSIDADIAWIDMNPWVCPAGTCFPAVGGVLTFRDADHLTATYVTSLAPALRQELLKVL